MKRIAYYISDHGYGHASRSIAVIRHLLEKIEDVEVYVNCSYPLDFVKDSFASNDRVRFRKVKNDFGYVSDENIEIKVDKTKDRFGKWLDAWPSYIEKEKRFCESEDIDLIISDIAPQPFVVGEKLGISSIGLSNFTWYEIYRHLLGKKEHLEKLKEAYQKADLGLIYPFETDSMPFDDIKKVGLVARENKRDFKEVRKEMGVGEEEKLVYFGVGKSYFGKGQKIQFEDGFREDFSLMVSSGYDFVDEPEYTIPENETESQDYIGACDLIISKFGYGIVSEGIMSKTPMILARRKILEDEKGMERLKKYGLGEEISREDMIEGNFMSKIEKVYDKDPYEDMLDRLKRDGKKEIVETIEEFLY